ncbi:MAG TPA: 6-pyruvoyl-tetrahydropterin synthase-related protein [Gemmatimonadota bacterium]|nr:6-pyruvoyl-tetrahydropterin synthase-related protein [Gemmatimonadota bacterium]
MWWAVYAKTSEERIPTYAAPDTISRHRPRLHAADRGRLRRRPDHADDLHDIDVIDVINRYVDVEHRYVDVEHRHLDLDRHLNQHQRDDDHDLAGSSGDSVSTQPPFPWFRRGRDRNRSRRCRGALTRAAFIPLLALLATASPLSAQSIQLQLSLTIRPTPQVVHVSGAVANRGGDTAYEIGAELRGVDQTPRPWIGELAPGERAEIAWELDPARWRTELREIAALRIRYHDAGGTWASSVTALGEEVEADVEAPAWPEDPSLRVTWPEASAAGAVAWWSAIELGLEGADRWRSQRGRATTAARLQPATDITGWETTAFLLVLPDDPELPGRIVRVPVDARSFRALWRPDLPLLAGWTVLCLIGWLGSAAVARRRRGAHPAPSGSFLAFLPAALSVLILGAVLTAIFPPRLLLLDTTPAGGDYASHIVALDQLRNVLLPAGRIYGWSMDQYAGFPLFLFYFPLAFLVIVGLSAALPLTVAMKLGALAGPLLVPFAWVLALSWLGAPRAARWLAPAVALAFLLIEVQATWGGNLASLLAGEFAYGLGFPLAWLAVSHAWMTRDRPSGWWPAAVLLALTGLAHGYTLICGALGVALVAFHPRLWWRRCWHVARVGLLAFGLLAWWLIPLIGNLPWTNSFREQWEIDGLGDLLPAVVAAALVVLLVGVAWRAITGRRPLLAPGQLWLLAFGATMLVVYRLGFSLGVVDVRFLPMLHGALLLAGCWEAGTWIERTGGARRPLLAAAVILLVSGSSVASVVYLPSWGRWNMGGMERTSRWPDFDGVMRAVPGGIGAPRVAYEHHPDHNAVGTIRAFELLPWFSGRATLEGLYFQSAVLAPVVFYLQSETSLRPSCPLTAYECGRFQPSAAAPHLELLGASELVAYTDSLKGALAGAEEFEERARSGVYTVFALARPPRLVEPVTVRPVADRHANWRQEAYDWFRAGTDLDVPLVLDRDPDPAWAAVGRYRPGRLPRVPYAARPRVSGTVQDQTVSIETDTPGHPLLVKIGYHPGWQASDGSPIELVAPGMMLVTPRSERLTLVWSAGRAGRLGLLVTGLALAGLIAIGIVRRRAGPGLREPRLPEARRAGWVGIAAVLALAALAALVMLRRHPPVDFPALLAAGQRQLSDRRFSQAEAMFTRMLATDTPHGLRDDAAFYRTLVPLEAGDRQTALARLETFVDEYPVSTYHTEARVRMADLLTERGETQRARQALEEALAAPLAPEGWRVAARERLARIPEASPAEASPAQPR